MAEQACYEVERRQATCLRFVVCSTHRPSALLTFSHPSFSHAHPVWGENVHTCLHSGFWMAHIDIPLAPSLGWTACTQLTCVHGGGGGVIYHTRLYKYENINRGKIIIGGTIPAYLRDLQLMQHNIYACTCTRCIRLEHIVRCCFKSPLLLGQFPRVVMRRMKNDTARSHTVSR
jgi:hypothetical protein